MTALEQAAAARLCVAPPRRFAPADCASPPPRITVLCGGLGGARLALALQAAGLEGQCCFVTNVGDDCEVDGLLVCPDTDAVVYALGGLFDEERGWGIRGDVFPSPTGDSWFHVGRRDREQHTKRDVLLRAGRSLGDATANMARALGVEARVLPATDDRLRTVIRTPSGALAWQEWLVRERAHPLVTAVEYRGIERARAAVGAQQAIAEADLLLFAASSPVASIGPILALPGIVDAIRARRGATVALSPVTRRRPLIKQSDAHRAAARAALLSALGIDHEPVAIARHYAHLIDAFVVDAADAADAPAVRALGMEALVAPLVDLAGGARLVASLLSRLPARRGHQPSCAAA